MRRGFTTEQEAFDLLDPPELPDPKSQFPDLAVAVERVSRACTNQEALAICGDYDADGMTSSALLLQALSPLGARPTATAFPWFAMIVPVGSPAVTVASN